MKLIGYRMIKLNKLVFFDAILERFGNSRETLYVVQIGANDGVQFDPLHHFLIKNHQNIKALLLEPIEEYYINLVRNYSGFENLLPLQLAIHNSERQMTVYKVDNKRITYDQSHLIGIASFDRNHYKRSGISAEHIKEESVSCAPLSEVLSNHKFPQVDILQIDAEGYDCEIVLNIDFRQIKPTIIHFEHSFSQGVTTSEKLEKVIGFLNKNGYQIVIEESDATAYLPSHFMAN